MLATMPPRTPLLKLIEIILSSPDSVPLPTPIETTSNLLPHEETGSVFVDLILPGTNRVLGDPKTVVLYFLLGDFVFVIRDRTREGHLTRASHSLKCELTSTSDTSREALGVK